MSLSSLLTKLANVRGAIVGAISSKGVALASSATLHECASAIQSITVGTAKAAATYTPTTSDQTITAGQYLTGDQTIKGDANLLAANIVQGVTIFGVTGTASGGGGSTDFYKCATVSSASTETYYAVSEATATEYNGDYYDSGDTHDGYPIYTKGVFALFYSADYDVWCLTNELENAIQQDAYAFSYYHSPREGAQGITGNWEVTDGGEPTVTEMHVEGTDSNTWTGYKAVQDPVTGIYSFEATATTGLVYGSGMIPQVGGVYNSDATIAATLYQGDSLNIPGLVFHAPLNAAAPYAMTGQALSGTADSYETVQGIPCARFSSLAANLTASDSALPHGNSAVALSCWLNFQTIPGDFSGLLNYGNNMSFGQSIAFPDWASVLFSGAPGENALTSVTPSQGTWYHFLSVYDGAGTIINYVNGVQSGQPYSINLTIGSGDINIANSEVSRDLCLAGIRIYNRALTPAEIATLAAEFTPSV